MILSIWLDRCSVSAEPARIVLKHRLNQSEAWHMRQIGQAQILRVDVVVNVHRIRPPIAPELLDMLPRHPASSEVRREPVAAAVRREPILELERLRIVEPDAGGVLRHAVVNMIPVDPPARLGYEEGGAVTPCVRLPCPEPVGKDTPCLAVKEDPTVGTLCSRLEIDA